MADVEEAAQHMPRQFLGEGVTTIEQYRDPQTRVPVNKPKFEAAKEIYRVST